MYQSVGGFVLGAIAALLLVFFFPGALDDLRGIDWSFGQRGIDVGLAQPFAIAGDSNPLDADDVWSDAPAASCQGVLAVENRSRDPVSVAMAVRYRDQRGGALVFADGQDQVELEPGAEIDRAIGDATLTDPRACAALNTAGTLVIAAEICPDAQDAQSSDCRDIAIDPAPYAGGPARRGVWDRDGKLESRNMPAQDDAAPRENEQ